MKMEFGGRRGCSNCVVEERRRWLITELNGWQGFMYSIIYDKRKETARGVLREALMKIFNTQVVWCVCIGCLIIVSLMFPWLTLIQNIMHFAVWLFFSIIFCETIIVMVLLFVSVRVLYDKNSGRSRGFRFINFSSGHEAKSTKHAMDGKVRK